MTNNSFDSSTSTYSISTSLSGWTGQVSDRKTTAGIINVGSTFSRYMSSTYYLSSNPSAKGSDSHILMINSRTSSDESYSPAHQGYKSSSITLEANSYYSFEVSFKSDTNYSSGYAYEFAGEIEGTVNISTNVFNGSSTTNIVGFGNYIQFTYNNNTYYFYKALEETPDISFNYDYEGSVANDEGDENEYSEKNVTVFYDDGEYVGVVIGDVGYFVDRNYVVVVEETSGSASTVHILKGAEGYLCQNITYNPSTTNYTIASGTTFYNRQTEYTPMTASSYGSIYLTQDDEILAEFLQVQSQNWVTFYIFIATGDESIDVNLELWLGSKNTTISGVVFYDECHIFQYSENAFWSTYQTYYDINYTQNYITTDSNGNATSIEEVTTDCTQLIDLRDESTTIDLTGLNFDFEDGIYNSDVSSLSGWTKDEKSTGNARIFDVRSASFFKTTTGYSFVGSMMDCEVTLDENNAVQEINENQYVLALWTDDNYVKVTSGDISISSNEIYKITVYYKISELDGSVYVYVEENDNLLEVYGLTEYTVTEETASSAVTENGDNTFINDYGTIEFYVKGSALYDSSINISISVGSEDETATGCVVFDNITVEKASTSDYSDATNSVELGTISASPSITNGNFNSVTIETGDTAPFTPESWTITSSNGTYAGVINTDANKYAEYVALRTEYQQNEETSNLNNPYYWAFQSNPKSSTDNTETADNVLMLANILSDSSSSLWQYVVSDSIELSADTTYKLTFSYKTSGTLNSFTVSIYGEDGFELFTSDPLSTSNTWKTYDIYLETFSGVTNIYIRIDFGTEDEGTNSFAFAYFDDFKLDSDDVEVPDGAVLIDMTDFYLNLPSNNITTTVSSNASPAYTYAILSGSSSGMSGGIVSSEKFNSESSEFKIETDEAINVFFLQSQGEGSNCIQSNFYIDLEAENYYALTFKLKTYFNESDLKSDVTYSYGVTVGLTGFGYASELISNDGYKTYTIYFYVDEDTSAQLYIALVCDANETRGSMVAYDFDLSTVESSDYSSALETTTASSYDINSDRVYVSTVVESTETSEEEEEEDDDDEPVWLLYISSIIFGFAIIIAVVGYFLRKIKIKKIEIKRKESYDRKTSLNVEAIKLKAKQLQEEEINSIQQSLDKFQKELDSIEKEHKQKIVALREEENGKITKSTDKEFKLFAQKRTVIAEKLEALNKQIEDIKTPEYLLNLERKVYAQEEMKRRELEKASKKLNAEKSKTENEDKK